MSELIAVWCQQEERKKIVEALFGKRGQGRPSGNKGVSPISTNLLEERRNIEIWMHMRKLLAQSNGEGVNKAARTVGSKFYLSMEQVKTIWSKQKATGRSRGL